jgi:hypothetical protein
MSLSSQAHELVLKLTDGSNAVEPARFPKYPDQAAKAGMYAWWGDHEACNVLGEELGTQVSRLLYAGQAGATRWPSGVRSSATLLSRIAKQHIRGNTRSSTFRLTISSILLDRLALVAATGGRLDRPSNARVSAWIATHLKVSIAPFDDRDSLGTVEKEVVAFLDPPLNLNHCRPSDARALINERRKLLPR